MQNTGDMENIRKALEAIGQSRLPLNDALVNEIITDLISKGYDEAVVHAEQAYLAEDVNAEIVRVLTISRRCGLSSKQAAQVLDILSGPK